MSEVIPVQEESTVTQHSAFRPLGGSKSSQIDARYDSMASYTATNMTLDTTKFSSQKYLNNIFIMMYALLSTVVPYRELFLRDLGFLFHVML